jgi:DNA-binding transcriptional ArsR family regulator
MATQPRAKQTLVDLAQIRALANPLRLRILAVLGEPRTTKQVAGLLGEKPTKLYHHVQVMERAGLVRLTDRRPKRGTVEKYYQAVATLFEAGPGIFAPPAGARGRARSGREAMLVALLETAREEVAAHFADDAAAPAAAPAYMVGGARIPFTSGSRASRATVLRQFGRMIDQARGKRKYVVTAVIMPVRDVDRTT